MLWSPDGLAREGFTLKVLFAGGSYHICRGQRRLPARRSSTDVMPGWRFKGDRYEAMIFAGVDLQSITFVPDDPGNRLRGMHRCAARRRRHLVSADRPDDGDGVGVRLDGCGANFWSRAALGWRFLDWVWVGPEASAYGDHDYQQLRFGVHVDRVQDRPLRMVGRLRLSLGFRPPFRRLWPDRPADPPLNDLNRACGGSASPRSSSRSASARPAPARRSAGPAASRP